MSDEEAVAQSIFAAIRAAPNMRLNSLEQLLEDSLPVPDDDWIGPPEGQIDEIAIQGIRSFGPVQRLRLSGGLTILYGANGKGKTSLVDALELAVTGETTRGIAHPGSPKEVLDAQHVPHLDRSGAPSIHSPLVGISWKDDLDQPRVATWNGTFDEPARRAPDIEVIARRRLREMVSARPSDRITHIGDALGFTELNEFGAGIARHLKERAAALREACDNSHGGGVHHLDSQLSKNLKAENLPNKVREWAAETGMGSGAIPLPPEIPEPDDWGLLSREWRSHFNSGPPTGRTQLDSSMRELLRSFREVVDDAQKTDRECPACRAGMVTRQRVQEIDEQLAQLQDLEKYDATTSRLRKEFDSMCAAAATIGPWEIPKEFTSSSAPGTDEAWVSEAYEEWVLSIEALARALQAARTTPTADSLDGVSTKLAHLRLLALDFCDEIEKRFRQGDSPQQRLARRISRSPDKESSLAAGELADLRREKLVIRRLEQAAKSTKGIVETRIVRRLSEMQVGIKEWMEILAPSETPEVTLGPRQTSGSLALEIYADPGPEGRPIHALGHLSDAQVDMLGLSIHLARIEREHPHALIVFDDPTDMLDSPTRKNFASTGLKRLMDDPSGRTRQVLVLTHDDALVRELWSNHRERKPATAQDDIDFVCAGNDTYSAFASRDSDAALSRAMEFIHEHRESKDRLWVRSAVAVMTRRAVEMYVKDLGVLLGPAGLGFIDALEEKSDLSRVTRTVRTSIVKLQGSCDSPQHNGRTWRIDRIRDLLRKSEESSLNPGAHADVILPEVSTCKDVIEGLAPLIRDLQPPDDAARSDWITESPLATLLRPCPDCS